MKPFPILLVVALFAGAAEAREFGDAGVIAPSGSISFASSSDVRVLSIQPSLQYFVVPGLALGLGVTYGHLSIQGSSRDVYGIQPSLGYNLRLADTVSVFPQAFFSVTHGTGGGTSDSDALVLTLFAPVLFHAVPHFFVGIGPAASTGGPSSDVFRSQSIGFQTALGGWF